MIFLPRFSWKFRENGSSGISANNCVSILAPQRVTGEAASLKRCRWWGPAHQSAGEEPSKNQARFNAVCLEDTSMPRYTWLNPMDRAGSLVYPKAGLGCRPMFLEAHLFVYILCSTWVILQGKTGQNVLLFLGFLATVICVSFHANIFQLLFLL